MLQVALLTDSVHRDLYEDDRVLIPAFKRQGIEARPVIWDQVSEINFESAIIRNTWDYFHQVEKFISTLESFEKKGVRLWNSSQTVRWNSTKLYLKQLAGVGISTIPTLWIEKKVTRSLEQILSELDYNEAVIKPIVGGGSFLTVRIKKENCILHQTTFDEILKKIDTTLGAMIQPFIPEIVTEGEWSLVFFNNDYSHAVLRKPKTGDFRVQPQHGASTENALAPAEMVEYAKDILKTAAKKTLYARVDLIRQQDGKFLLGELEMTEPRLAFSASDVSADRFVDTFLKMNA